MLLATQTEGLSRLFDLDFQLLADSVLMIIAMFFLFMFASHFLFDPVRNMLKARQDKIKGELEEAAADKQCRTYPPSYTHSLQTYRRWGFRRPYYHRR